MRIAPNELSINDLEVYRNTIYAQNTKFSKAPYYYEAFDTPGSSVFSERSRALHSQEKRLMSHAFSRANVLGMQSLLYHNVSRWIAQLRTYAVSKKPIPLWHATQCLTLETASCFSYGSSDGALDTNDFEHPLFMSMEAGNPLVIVFQHFPILKRLALALQAIIPFGFPQINTVWSSTILVIHHLT